MELERPDLMRIGVAAGGVDPRTVARVINGKPTKPGTRRRVVGALLELGYAVPSTEKAA